MSSHFPTTYPYLTLRIEKAAVGTVKNCCFYTPQQKPYGTSFAGIWSLNSVSLNSTARTKNSIVSSPYDGGSDESAFYDNNNSLQTSEGSRSCDCHLRTPKGRDDVCCFFSGSSCAGLHSIALNGQSLIVHYRSLTSSIIQILPDMRDSTQIAELRSSIGFLV